MPELQPGIALFHPADPWENVHLTFRHSFTPNASYELTNGLEQPLEDYKRATKNFQWLIQQAQESRRTLRAMGSNWSFSRVAMCPGGMVQTKKLSLIFPVGNTSLHPDYLDSGKTADDLRFVQCGTQIATLSRKLETGTQPRRSIRASGGSNGQSIAGATATGTHGGALFLGAVHDTIAGLHLVSGVDRSIYLERTSAPVVTQSFADAIGAELVRDDALFNAAIVSFGSFGFIHGMMVETEPLFLLQEYGFDNVLFSDGLTEALATLDMARLQTLLPGMPADRPDCRLYHLEININPFTVKKNQQTKGFYVRMFYKVPAPAGYQPDHEIPAEESLRPELLDVMEGVIKELNGNLGDHIVRSTVISRFEEAMRPPTHNAQSIGTIFRITRFRGNVASFAFAIDISHVPQVLDEALALNQEIAFAGGLAMRFVKGTQATLGFTRFPNSCVVELDGLDIPRNHHFCEQLWSRLESRGIPYTLHWGKLNNILDRDRVTAMYGPDKVNSWKRCREQLLDAEARQVFTNAFMQQCGLDTPAEMIA